MTASPAGARLHAALGVQVREVSVVPVLMAAMMMGRYERAVKYGFPQDSSFGAIVGCERSKSIMLALHRKHIIEDAS